MSDGADPVAVVTGDGSNTLFNARYCDTYHSTFGALTEAKHVFLCASGLAQRLDNGQQSRVLEIGFGLGLNFLLTADHALSASSVLHYQAFEHDLPDLQTLESMNYGQFLQHPQLASSLFEGLRDAGNQQVVEIHFSSSLTLYLNLQDACGAALPDGRFHAIYLDAFSPESNAECWSPAFISALASALTNDGRISTYSAKGAVRRAMLTAGLHVKKRAGPPGKREMLIADRTQIETTGRGA